MIKFIYFDVGGVFVNCNNFFKKVSADFHVSHFAMLQQWDLYDDEITLGKITPQEFWDKVRLNLNIPGGENYDFVQNWVSDYVPINETYKFVIELSGCFNVGLISNMYEGMIPILIKEHMLPDIPYKAMVISCDVGMKKPNSDIYKFAQQKANVNASEILFIDDREDFMDGAKNCGWQTIQFQTFQPEISINEIIKLLKI